VDGQPTESALLEKVKLIFTECVLSSNEAECEILSDGPGTTGTTGVIEWEPIDVDFQNQSTEDSAIEFLPESGTTFGNYSVDSKMGHTCPFATLVTIKTSAEGNPLCVLLASNETLEEVDQDLKDIECNKALFEAFGFPAELTATFDVILDRPMAWNSER
jgi:hypothetical protein